MIVGVHRVGFVVRYWPAWSETFVVREVEGLRSRGVGVDVVGIGPRDGIAPEALRPPRGAEALALLPPLSVLSRTEARGAFGWLLRTLRPKDALRVLWVADRGARERWDRVHAHFAGEAGEWAYAAARVLGVPFSVTVHAVDLFKPRPTFDLLLRAARPARPPRRRTVSRTMAMSGTARRACESHALIGGSSLRVLSVVTEHA